MYGTHLHWVLLQYYSSECNYRDKRQPTGNSFQHFDRNLTTKMRGMYEHRLCLWWGRRKYPTLFAIIPGVPVLHIVPCSRFICHVCVPATMCSTHSPSGGGSLKSHGMPHFHSHTDAIVTNMPTAIHCNNCKLFSNLILRRHIEAWARWQGH